MAWICVERIEKKNRHFPIQRYILLYPKIVWTILLQSSTTKKMFRLTHQESGGEKKKTWLRNQNWRKVTYLSLFFGRRVEKLRHQPKNENHNIWIEENWCRAKLSSRWKYNGELTAFIRRTECSDLRPTNPQL